MSDLITKKSKLKTDQLNLTANHEKVYVVTHNFDATRTN